MNTKLTLSLSEPTIEKAKRIAKVRGTSLSKMVEQFFNSLSETKQFYQPESLDARVAESRGRYQSPKEDSKADSRLDYLRRKHIK